MLRVTIANLAGHRRRLIGTLLTIVSGVAFLSGTLALGNTLDANFERLFDEANAGTAATVRPEAPFVAEPGAGRPVVDESLMATLQAVPGVADVEGVIEGYGRIIGSDGEGIGGNGPPTLAGSWITNPDLNPFTIVDGRAPEEPDEVVINRGAATAGGLTVGDRTTVQVPEPIEVTIVGIATFGDADGLGPTTFTGFTLPAAQDYLLDGAAQVHELVVEAEPGVGQAQLAADLATVVPDGVEVVSGTDLAQEMVDEISRDFLDGFSAVLAAFGAVALGVAAFSIHNTFAILLAQRSKQWALLRALGASRDQVLGSVGAEAFAVGLVGSVIGAAAGFGVAAGLIELFHLFGFPLPAGGLTIDIGSAAISTAAGLVVTVVAALAPAVRASRVAPLAALRDVAAEATRTSRSRIAAGVVLTAAGVALVLTGGATGFGSGAAAFVAGVVVLGPVVAKPLASVLGAPLARLRGVSGVLARRNAVRNPRRTASAATALVVGVGVVSLVMVTLASLIESSQASYEEAFGGDLAIASGIFGGGSDGFTADLATDLAALPEIGAVAGLGFGEVLLDGDLRQVTVADPGDLDQVTDLGVTDGSLPTVSDSGIAVPADTAAENGWDLGTVLTVTYPDGDTSQLTVEAVFSQQGPVIGPILPRNAWAPHVTQNLDTTVLLSLSSGTELDAALGAASEVAAVHGAPPVQTREQYVDEQSSALADALGIVYALLGLSIIIALFGIANTLSLSIHERTRELGLLRAVGLTASGVRSMVRWEAGIIAVVGTVGGLVLGLLLGWGAVRDIGPDLNIDRYAVPLTQLAIVLVVGGIAGLIAGARPARRAARLRLLDTLAAD